MFAKVLATPGDSGRDGAAGPGEGPDVGLKKMFVV
jgi:hypothetical protein